MIKKNKFITSKTKSQEMSLNITSMADIFTILLVFLLKSMSSSGPDVPPLINLTLPSAKVEKKPPENVRLEVSKSEILLDQKKVMTLNQFAFSQGDLEANGVSKILATAFAQVRAKMPLREPAAGSEKNESPSRQVVVLLDRETPYLSVKTALASAATQGFTHFKLIVTKPEE